MNEEKMTVAEQLAEQKGSNRSRRLMGGVLLLAVLVAGGGLWYYFTAESKTVSYRTEAARVRDLIVTVSATGNLEPTNTVDVGIEVSGTIAEVYADYNDRVKPAQLLARLDTTKLESKVRNSKAALAVARANLADAEVSLQDTKNELERSLKMFESTGGNYPSDKEMDAVHTAYKRAEATYKGFEAKVIQAEAALQTDEEDVRKAVVRSPMEGIILARKIEVGQTVVASMQIPVLFTIAEDLKKMEVIVSVDEADIGQVQEAQKVSFTVDAYPQRTFEGEITQVRLNSEIVDGVVTYEAVVVVDNSELLLRPGMTATADIQTRRFENVLSVPNAALRFTPSASGEVRKAQHKGSGVWVLKGKQPVHIGVKTGESDGSYTAILEGLEAGTEVILGIRR